MLSYFYTHEDLLFFFIILLFLVTTQIVINLYYAIQSGLMRYKVALCDTKWPYAIHRIF